jgi:hypothetical protein
MSASDAAPLPRLGEVFFDVRGNSRSMRLSWYADTGVAVFSIWQGGVCTGTFRLPIGDLPRMIEILQRGPHGHYPDEAGEHGGQGYAEPAYDGDYDADYLGGDHGGDSDYAPDEYGGGGQHSGRYRQSDYGDSEYGSAEYGSGGYGGGYTGAGYGDQGYADDRYPDAGQRSDGYGSAGHGPPDYRQAPDPRPARRRDDDRYQPDVTGERSVAADETEYGQQRFAPPYVRPQPGSSEAGYLDDSEYRFTADPGAGARHSAGRHSSGRE